MSSTVYYSSMVSKGSASPLKKISKLMNKCNAKEIYGAGDLVGIKTHFGELGNAAFVRPIFFRPIVELLQALKAKPFLVDTNTLYVGMRANSIDHLHNANMNGFGYSTLQTPVIIADGLRGEETTIVPVPKGEIFKEAKIASGILNADALVVVSHFKGHIFTGIGGAIKNLSMGCASRGGKLAMHSASKPYVQEEQCTACGRCKTVCQVQAIEISKRANITDRCTGCVRCVGVCPVHAITFKHNNTGEEIERRMAEYASAVTSAVKKPIIYLNFLTDISPACDCMPGNDAPVTGDLGYMASMDPVAIDKACLDMVKDSCHGHNPFKAGGEEQLIHGVKVGLGSMDYTLNRID